MITHERLKELIEKGAKIWCICDYTYHKGKPNKKIEYYDLSSEDVCISPAEFRDYGLRIYNSLGYWNDVRYENLFETEEEAEWHKEFCCIERTERLELPNWEELFDFDKAKRFLDCYTQEFAITKKRSVIGVALFGVDFTNKIIEVSIGSEKLFVEELTKENYLLACRKAKELFLGEE